MKVCLAFDKHSENIIRLGIESDETMRIEGDLL